MVVGNNDNKNVVLEVSNVTHVYMENTPFEHTALKNVHLKVNEGESVAIIGHTGSGKSTLVQYFNGLMRPTEGKVVIDNDPKMSIRKMRQKVGLVFQNPEDQIFEKVIGDDIAYGPLKMGLSIDEVREKVRWAMDIVGLSFEDMKDRPTYALSGGQKRKVALAGVLALQPKILVLDEPTAGLDPQSRIDLLSRLKKLKDDGMTIIFISHNMEEVAYLADKVCVMISGEKVLEGTPREIFGNANFVEMYDIGLPETVEILHQLNKSNFKVNTAAYEVENASTEIVNLIKGGRVNASPN